MTLGMASVPQGYKSGEAVAQSELLTEFHVRPGQGELLVADGISEMGTGDSLTLGSRRALTLAHCWWTKGRQAQNEDISCEDKKSVRE